MQRKVFLNRKPKSSGAHSYPKLLMWAALGLMVLVLLTPLLTRTPSHKTVSQPPPVQKGAVFAKIPKAASQDAEKQAMRLAGIKPAQPQQKSATTEPTPAQSQLADQSDSSNTAPVPKPVAKPVVPPAPEPAAATPPVVAGSEGTGKIAAEQTEAAPAAVPAATPPVKPAASADVSTPPAAPHKAAAVTAPRSTPATPSPSTATKEHQATAAKPAPVKSAVAPKGWEYIVRVGSFSSMKNAEKLQKMLEKKGYEVVVKPYQHPTLGLLHIVELRPVREADKAIHMLIAIQKVTHAKPMLVKIPDNG